MSESSESTGLWNGMEIEVIGVCGEYQSGKTLFALCADPAGTIYYDFEKSGGTYAGLNVASRIDVPAELQRLHPKGYKPIDAFVWWRDQIRSLKAGQYTVVAVDPISDIEQGLVEWVRANPEHFGHTANQYANASGLMWSDVKSYWKMLLVDLTSRCKTFIFTSHMRYAWKGSSPTSRREPKGKETLMELASLYLLLERKPDKNGKVAAKPSAVVLKSRLASVKTSAAGEVEIVPTLPPRLPIATSAEIRKYISAPPDYKKLKRAELYVEPEMSEDEKLLLRHETAEAERSAEEMKLSRLDKMWLSAKRAAKQKLDKTRAAATPDRAAEAVAEKAAKADADVKAEVKAEELQESAEPQSNGRATKEILKNISELVGELKIPDEAWSQILAKRGVDKLVDLSQHDAEQLRDRLWNRLTATQLESDIKGQPSEK